MSEDLLARIRDQCRWVAEGARLVRVRPDRVPSLAHLLAGPDAVPSYLDPARTPFLDERDTVAYVLTLDAINFGSGWFPHMRMMTGLSGYGTVAVRLRERFETDGPFSPDELAELTPRACATLLGQEPDGPLEQLCVLYARGLNDLGRLVRERFGKRFEALVQSADCSARRLVGILSDLSFFRDEVTYRGATIPFYKKAQITAADLSLALGNAGLGRFDDLDQLTVFADNVVRHVLRVHGVLEYDPDLLARIDAGELLPAGSEAEVEIRAAAVHAGELLVEALRRQGTHAIALDVDGALWKRGRMPAYRSPPPHLTRTVFY